MLGHDFAAAEGGGASREASGGRVTLIGQTELVLTDPAVLKGQYYSLIDQRGRHASASMRGSSMCLRSGASGVRESSRMLHIHLEFFESVAMVRSCLPGISRLQPAGCGAERPRLALTGRRLTALMPRWAEDFLTPNRTCSGRGFQGGAGPLAVSARRPRERRRPSEL